VAVKKEYICFAHGRFEADSPVCPKGCTLNVERRFFSAPAAKSNRTSNIDRMLRSVAADFGLSDMSNRNGSVALSQRRGKADFRPVWGEIPKGDTYNAGTRSVEKRKGGEGGMNAALSAYRVAPKAADEVGITDVASKLPGPKPIIDKKLTYGSVADLQAAMKSAP
jgi:hypothetical protein